MTAIPMFFSDAAARVAAAVGFVEDADFDREVCSFIKNG